MEKKSEVKAEHRVSSRYVPSRFVPNFSQFVPILSRLVPEIKIHQELLARVHEQMSIVPYNKLTCKVQAKFCVCLRPSRQKAQGESDIFNRTVYCLYL